MVTSETLSAPAGAGPGTRARSRGGDAHSALVAAAARLFAARGFDGVTVRELAQAANVNVAAVSYHFGGKRQLYLEALERLMAEMRPIGAPVIEQIDRAFEMGRPDRATLKSLAAFTVSHFLTALHGGDVPPWVAQTVLREFQEPTADYRPMLDERVLPLHQAIRRMTAAALEMHEDSAEAILTAHAFMGQIMVYATARAVVLEELAWTDFSDARLGKVIDAAKAAAFGLLRLDGIEEGRICGP